MPIGQNDVDRGYAWVVLLISWLINVVSGMLYYSTGVINSAVLERMQEGVVKTSWVASTLLGALAFTGLITSTLTNLWGCRVITVAGGVVILVGMVGASFANTVNGLIVSYGIIVGLGIAFIDTGSIVMAGHYFDKYRPLASGIQSSGAGWGMLMGGPLTRYLLDVYGLSGTFLILGAIGSHACVCGMLLRPSQYERKGRTAVTMEKHLTIDDAPSNIHSSEVLDEEVTQNQILVLDVEMDLLQKGPSSRNNGTSSRNNGTSSRNGDISFGRRCIVTAKYIVNDVCGILTNMSFMMYMLSFMLWGFGEAAFHVHLPNYVESKGTTPQQSATLFTSMGLASMVGRILIGFAGNDPSIGTLILHTGLLGLAGICVCLFATFSSTYIEHMVFVAVYGLYTGGCIALFSPNSAELIGAKHLASAIGVKNLICGLGVLLGPPFAGFILDYTGSYDISYYCSGIALVAASMASLPVSMFKKKTDTGLQLALDYEMADRK